MSLMIEEYLAKNCLSITPKLDIDSYEIALEILLKGVGIAVFNKPLIEDLLKSGKLVEIKTDIVFPIKDLYVAVNKNNMNSDFIKNIIKILCT